jgi:hypothetical protein
MKTSAILRFTRILTLACALTFGSGCSDQDFAKVAGHVRYSDGSPIDAGYKVIRFEPLKKSPEDHRRPGFSNIAEDGSFEMMTRQEGDGVAAGMYAVTFSVLNNQQEAISLIPDKYTVPRTSPFEVVVERDDHDMFFELEKK